MHTNERVHEITGTASCLVFSVSSSAIQRHNLGRISWQEVWKQQKTIRGLAHLVCEKSVVHAQKPRLLCNYLQVLHALLHMATLRVATQSCGTKSRDKIARMTLVLSRQKLMAKTLRYLDVHFSTKRHFIAADLQQSDVARLTDVNA